MDIIYLGRKTLSYLWEKIKAFLSENYSVITHTHTKSEITDLTVDSSLSSTSTNPVQNKIVNSALNEKVPITRTINKKSLDSNISLSASDVGADASGTANSVVSTHNTSTSAHGDIRLLITDLETVLNNFLDVDDTTKDQLSEVIALINNNKGTLESLTTSKVNVADIINNLTTNVSTKPLSAAQGVVIKALIDTLQSELDTLESTSNSHISNKSNPHGVTLSQLGVTATIEELNILDGITVTTDELNYVDGAISNIQMQLNGKADSNHTHDYLPLTGGTVTGDTIFNESVTIGNGVFTYDSTNKRIVISVS